MTGRESHHGKNYVGLDVIALLVSGKTAALSEEVTTTRDELADGTHEGIGIAHIVG